MSYLTCPACGLSLYDRNPLLPSRHCPRCAVRDERLVELQRVQGVGGAAASVLAPRGELEDLRRAEPRSED